MRVFQLDDVLPILEDKLTVVDAVKQGFVAHSQGLINLPTPMQMIFERNNKTISGDCHVKAASSAAYPYFCMKIATGFYDNPELGLPVNNGVVMLLSSETGQPLAMFQDEGYMTSIRTAAAGALSAKLVQNKKPKRLGIIGTGHQAELQAKWIAASMDISNIVIWGRSYENAKTMAGSLSDLSVPVDIAETSTALCEVSDIVITTTPSNEPILMAQDIREGHHIIALGADSPGKRELDPKIIAKADIVITDDVAQCSEHGELGWAIRAGLVQADKALPLGKALNSNTGNGMFTNKISVVDLTGLGAQDLALASLVYGKLTSAA